MDDAGSGDGAGDVAAAAGAPAAAAPLRVLLLTQVFNALAQRLHVELRRAGHRVSVELDIADAVTIDAVARFDPDVVVAPCLVRRIPAAVWQRRVCLVVHPGPPGDGGPSALDWAVLRGLTRWGVTVLQATDELDAGPVWAWAGFDLRPGATKGSLYRREVTQAAAQAVAEALGRFVRGRLAPRDAPRLPAARGAWQPLLRRDDRAVDWTDHDRAEILRRVRSADGAPGAQARLLGRTVRLFDAHAAALDVPPGLAAGTAFARRGPALAVAARGGALWIGHVRGVAADGRVDALKLPATTAFAADAARLPELASAPLGASAPADGAELAYREHGPPDARAGWLAFEFHNGAMSERQGRLLESALLELRRRPLAVLVLAGGADVFSHGIHLHEIEHASRVDGDSAAAASWRNIVAMDDAVLALLETTDRLTVAALRGGAGAGGCFLALACDEVWAHPGVVLNPHYRDLGNLHGSEYWTYTLPRRLGAPAARALMQRRLPLGAAEAAGLGLVDACFGRDVADFEAAAWARALALAGRADHAERVADKQRRRRDDEAARPLAEHRADELAQMRRNFEGPDPSYHVARHHFVHRKPPSRTPRHLALHR